MLNPSKLAQLNQIPEKKGYLLLSENDKIVAAVPSFNLQKTVAFFFQNEHPQHIQMQIDDLDDYNFVSLENPLDILINLKIIKQDNIQTIINNFPGPSMDYVYLALDFNNYPFVKITEDTQENKTYLGPFPSRFILGDVIYTFGELKQLPVCEEEINPCSRFKAGKCPAYCVKNSPADLLKEYYLKVNDSILQETMKTFQSYYDDLEFTKADFTQKQINLLDKYYQFLEFFQRTKQINAEIQLDKGTIKIINGLITEIKINNKMYNFEQDLTEYRENELWAVNKQEFWERWVIYSYLKENQPTLFCAGANS